MKSFIQYLFIFFIALTSCSKIDIPIRITEDLINKKISKDLPYKFPVAEKDYVLEKPVIDIKSEKIYMTFSMNKKENEIFSNIGEVKISTGLTYNNSDKTFYIFQPQVDQADIGDTNLIEKGAFLAILNTIFFKYLEEIPIYTLNKDDIKQNLARFILKKIEFDEDFLTVHLGI